MQVEGFWGWVNVMTTLGWRIARQVDVENMDQC
jgi:hypothetical protein